MRDRSYDGFATRLVGAHNDPMADPVAQQDFLRAIRHELRTPVNHIIGYSEMLLDDAEEQGFEAALTSLRQVRAAGRLLLGHINDELSSASVALFGSDISRLSQLLRAPLHQILADCSVLSRLSPAPHPQFASDVQKIASAAEHLLETLSGPLEPAVLQAHTEMEHGYNPIPDPDPAPLPEVFGRLLVVDDNDLNRDMLSRRLEKLGYTVATVENGTQALDLLRAETFDMVLLDIMMPVMNGYQVLEQLKADPVLRYLPVIMLSATDEVVSVVRCIEMGADDYLQKPFDPVLLRARIGASLEKKRLHDKELSFTAQIQREKKRADDLLQVVIPIGVALTNEKDFNQMLERIVVEAQALCNADGGTLYLRTDDDLLQWVIVRNTSLGIALGGTTGQAVTFPPLRMYEEGSGKPNHHYVVIHSALTGTTINIRDAYDADGFDFSGTRSFDQQTGYRSQSFVNVPLKDSHERVIGVLQLLNAQDPETRQVIPFDENLQQNLESLSTLAGVALVAYAREQRLQQQIEELRIEIDEVRKARQVAEITETDYFQQLQERARRMRGKG